MSYSHTRAQLKRSSEFVYRRPKSLRIKIQVKTKLLNRRYDWISSESKKRRRRPAGHTAGLFSFRINPAIAAGHPKVEITYQDGTSKIATVTSRYDSKNDWINLRAYGLTYSTPQLAISFKQPDAARKVILGIPQSLVSSPYPKSYQSPLTCLVDPELSVGAGSL